MKSTSRLIPLLALALLFTGSQVFAQFLHPGPFVPPTGTGTGTGTTNVSVTIGPLAGLTIANRSTPLTTSGSNFDLFEGNTSLTYYVRTTATGGGGSITLKVTSDFSPAGGPSVTSPLTPTDALTYTCAVASPGTACTGTQTVSTNSQTNLATFGTDVHTGTGGSTASVQWSLANDPSYKTGKYNATVTFTISAS
jgi:hypothetical protein